LFSVCQVAHVCFRVLVCGFAIHDLFLSGAKLRQLCSFALH
jgi:hypothetical protein